MTRRFNDTVKIESVSGGDFPIVIDRATQYEITCDLTQPSIARFEIGDDSTWGELGPALATGGRYRILVNGRPVIVGRLLTKGTRVTAYGGATVQLTVRTTLADAMFTTVDPAVGVKNTTLDQVLLRAYAKMGLTNDSFVFNADLSRDIITGKGKTGKAPKDLTKIKEDEARPKPPETIFAYVERHLARFHLAHWDAPDGRIVVGEPNDTQLPTYYLRCRLGAAGASNNLLGATRTEDFEEVPRELWVWGEGGGKKHGKAKVRWVEHDATLAAVEPTLDRTAIIIDEAVKTQAQAEARARREMSRRALMSNSWSLEADGLSFWDGSDNIVYGVDTVADVTIDVAGGASGAYLIYQATLRGDADSAHTTQLTAVKKGIWKL